MKILKNDDNICNFHLCADLAAFELHQLASKAKHGKPSTNMSSSRGKLWSTSHLVVGGGVVRPTFYPSCYVTAFGQAVWFELWKSDLDFEAADAMCHTAPPTNTAGVPLPKTSGPTLSFAMGATVICLAVVPGKIC